MTKSKLDHIDISILQCLQRDATLSQREIAEQVGLSQNACWRRMQRLVQTRVLRGSRARLDRAALGLDLTVFMMVRTRHHSKEWADGFRRHAESIAEVTELHRIGGDWDYLLKVVTTSMSGYDSVYQRLTANLDLETVTGYFSMETIFEDRPLFVRPSE
ncbi:MAG: Lrp/AsnC family transcriptional regulator [Devosia sp.]